MALVFSELESGQIDGLWQVVEPGVKEIKIDGPIQLLGTRQRFTGDQGQTAS